MATRLKDSVCHACGVTLQMSESAYSDVEPTVGDISICLECCALGIFEPDMSIRPMTQGEFGKLTKHEQAQIRKTQAIIRTQCARNPTLHLLSTAIEIFPT